VQAATRDDAVQTYVDAAWVRVTATAAGAGYTLDAQFQGFSPVGPQPAAPVLNVLEMRYRVLANDTFILQVCRDAAPICPSSSWVTVGAPLTRTTTYDLWTVQLTPQGYNNGSPKVRIVDADSLGASPGRLAIDYLRVASS
jgi:hypothetical protein